MPLEEWLAFRDADGDALWERWIWRKAEANSEALRAAGLLTETSMQTSMGHGPPPSVR
jgi:hypothetical protein